LVILHLLRISPQTTKLWVEKSWAKNSPYRLVVVGSMTPLIFFSKISDACKKSTISHEKIYSSSDAHVRMKEYV
jgi:hypothetical protein